MSLLPSNSHQMRLTLRTWDLLAFARSTDSVLQSSYYSITLFIWIVQLWFHHLQLWEKKFFYVTSLIYPNYRIRSFACIDFRLLHSLDRKPVHSKMMQMKISSLHLTAFSLILCPRQRSHSIRYLRSLFWSLVVPSWCFVFRQSHFEIPSEEALHIVSLVQLERISHSWIQKVCLLLELQILCHPWFSKICQLLLLNLFLWTALAF